MPKLEPYDKKLPYSYALGLFPSLNLMSARPETVERLLLSPEAIKSDGADKLRQACRARGIREEEAERVLRRESKKDNCYAALVFKKYACALRPDANHVVLAQISDGGNLGTALRACLGFGVEDIAVIRPCVDVFDPRVLRASMGAFFSMNVAVFENFEAYARAFPKRKLYPFMLRGASPLPAVVREKEVPFSLIFGNEQTGLPDSFAEIGRPVFIPQTEKIDSLNLSVAVSVGVYAFMNA